MSGDVPGISLWNPHASWAVQLGKLAVVSSKMHELQRQLHGGGGGEGGGLLPCKPISMKIACVRGVVCAYTHIFIGLHLTCQQTLIVCTNKVRNGVRYIKLLLFSKEFTRFLRGAAGGACLIVVGRAAPSPYDSYLCPAGNLFLSPDCTAATHLADHPN